MTPPSPAPALPLAVAARPAASVEIGGAETSPKPLRALSLAKPPRRAWEIARRLATLAQPLFEHRLFQFALVGGLLFAVAPPVRPPEHIEVAGERLTALHRAEAGRAGGVITEAREREIDQRALEDEILYREGMRLGLDRNDGIVRQRVVQKVLFLAEEMGGASRPPDEAGLRAFFDANAARWTVGEQTRFAQIFHYRRESLAAWAEGPEDGPPPTGEASPVAAELDADGARITAMLGAGFVEALAVAPVGRWSGPVPSAFGWHLVRVLERRPARPARLDEVRPAVLEAYSVFRRQEAVADFLHGAFARYRVDVDGARLSHFTPSRRIAFRAVSSGED